MLTLQEKMQEFKQQLAEGTLPEAYKGLMDYILGLRTYLQSKYPEHIVTSPYPGYLDMTYFSFSPRSLHEHKLKVAIVFVYNPFRFEVWLAAANKQVQVQYWKLFKHSAWNRYPLLADLKGQDAIVAHVLVDDPDFNHPDFLTRQIESGTLKFIQSIEEFLSIQGN